MLRSIFLLTAIGMWPSTFARADLIVDSFELAHSYFNDGGYGNSASGAGLFDGRRTVNLGVTNATQQLDINNTTHRLDLSATHLNLLQGFDNTMTLTYDDTTPSVDLGAANAFAISLDDVQATAPWTMTVTFTGTSSVTPATRTLLLPDGFNSSLIIPFTTFDNPVTSLGPISSISLHFGNSNGTAPALSFGPVTLLTAVAVPEPSTMVLAAVSLLGITWRRQKSR